MVGATDRGSLRWGGGKKSDKKGIDWAEEEGGRRTEVGKSSVEWRLEEEEEGMDTFYYPGTTRRALVVKF